MKAYRALFETEISQTLIGNIQYCSKKELVLGNNKFKQQIENLTGIALKNERLGRPQKMRAEKIRGKCTLPLLFIQT